MGVNTFYFGCGYKQAEDIADLIRTLKGSFPIIPVETNTLPDEMMTEAVKDKEKVIQDKFTLGEKC